METASSSTTEERKQQYLYSKKHTVRPMEKKAKSNNNSKRKDVDKTGSKRKFKEKKQTMKDLTTKRLKIDRKRNTQTEVENLNHGRVIQPKYVHVGQPLDGSLGDDSDFNEWMENNLPSHHQKSNGIHWISVEHRENDAFYETKNIPDTYGLQSAFDDIEVVNTKTLKKLARNYSLTSGKWMLFGKTGREIDGLWRIVADGVIRGTIPTFAAKVSAVSEKDDNHVICIYNADFLNEKEVYAVRDGILNSGIDKPLKYKADVYTHLGINSSNQWGIDVVLYRGINVDYIKQPIIFMYDLYIPSPNISLLYAFILSRVQLFN